MDEQSNPIDLNKLQTLIHEGVEAIQSGVKDHQAILFVGDTGVGKSTLMSFLSGCQLIVKFDGLKTYLDSVGPAPIKIGHQKYSETSIPTKVSIDGMACYDCPGFKDNKGQEYQISNSFFIQRLLDVYGKIKIVLVIDQSHISEARADKLPRLIKSMHEAFGSFQDVQDGCCIVVNRADPQAEEADYEEQLSNILHLQNQNGHLFNQEQRNFLKYMIQMKRLMIFRRVSRAEENKLYTPGECQQKIIHCINTMHYAKSKHIQNIISESAKIAIHDFIDQIELQSSKKIQIICAHLLDIYTQRVHEMGQNVDGVIDIKNQLQELIEEIRRASNEQIMHILQKQIPPQDLLDFESDFASVMFFKNIYDKTQVYLSNLVTKIQSQLSYLTAKVDKRISVIQKQLKEAQERENELLEQRMKEQRKQEMRIRIMQLSDGLDNIEVDVNKKCVEKLAEINQMKRRAKKIADFMARMQQAKSGLGELSRMRKGIESEFRNLQRKSVVVGQFM